MLEQFEPGDHLMVARVHAATKVPFSHHGIYAGGYTVVEYNGPGAEGQVREISLFEFELNEQRAVKVFSPCSFEAVEIVARARSRIGEASYDLFLNNCEHFANWCRSGLAHSLQATTGIGAPLQAGAAMVTAVISEAMDNALPSVKESRQEKEDRIASEKRVMEAQRWLRQHDREQEQKQRDQDRQAGRQIREWEAQQRASERELEREIARQDRERRRQEAESERELRKAMRQFGGDRPSWWPW